MYINKAIIYGNLTRDPELKALPSGSKVCNFSMATNRTWKDQTGKKQESVDYHNIVFFGKQAEVIAQYMHKGNAMMVEGRITTRSWDGQDGKKNYRTEIVGENFQFGPKGGSSAQSQPSGGEDTSSAPEVDTIEYPTDDLNPNDIPF
jgi:single-strand DNA-binding protein